MADTTTNTVAGTPAGPDVGLDPGVIVGLLGGGLVAVLMLGVLLHLNTRPEPVPAEELEVEDAARDLSKAIEAGEFERVCTELVTVEFADDYEDCPADMAEDAGPSPMGFHVRSAFVEGPDDAEVTVSIEDQLGEYFLVMVWDGDSWRLESVSRAWG